MTNIVTLELVSKLNLLTQTSSTNDFQMNLEEIESVLAQIKGIGTDFSETQVRIIIDALVKANLWKEAVEIAFVKRDKDTAGCRLSFLGINMIEVNQIEEAESLIDLIQTDEKTIDAILCKIELIQELAIKLAKNQRRDQAISLLKRLPKIITELKDVRLDLQSKLFDEAAVIWQSNIRDEDQAEILWKQGISAANKVLDDLPNSSFEDILEARDALVRAFINMMKLGKKKLAENLVEKIKEPVAKKKVILAVHDYS